MIERDAAVLVSPAARRIAQERGIDLRSLRGTGPRGRIVRADVEAAAAALPAAGAGRAPEAGEVALTRVQRTIARRMTEAKRSAPDFAVSAEVDMGRCQALRAEFKAVAGANYPSVNDLVVRASALALREHPRVNASFKDDALELHSRVNIGVAVGSEGTLLVPTIFDADLKSVREIARETRALAVRARDSAITNAELADGTFTVSNLGMYQVRRFTAVLNPPQAAILAVGAVVPRMRIEDGEPAVRQVMDITVTCDHRILYGTDAARFLATIRGMLEQPAALLI